MSEPADASKPAPPPATEGQTGAASPTAQQARPASTTSRLLEPATLALSYAACSALWILFSDRALAVWFSDSDHFALASALKGWVFTGVTALLLYALLRRRILPAGGAAAWTLDAQEQVMPALRGRTIALQAAWLLILLAGLALAVVQYSLQQHQRRAQQFLHGLTELKVQQLDNWLRDRRTHARMLASTAELARRLSEPGAWTPPRLAELGTRLDTLRRLTPFSAARLLDPQGQALWNSAGESEPLDSGAAMQIAEIARQQEIRHLGPFRDGMGRLHLDLVVPLPAADGQPGQPAPVLLLHLGEDDYLPPLLLDWPVPSATGEILLLRRHGNRAELISPLRGQPKTALRLRAPSEPSSLLTQALHALPGEPTRLEGLNLRNARAIGKAQPVPDSDWVLVASLERSELQAAAVRDALWTVPALGMALLSVLGLWYLNRQRRRLALVTHTAHVQQQRLQAQSLLSAIAESSDDVIFAKDLQGRYTLFNRAGENFAARPAREVLGQDDSLLVPPEQAAMLAEASRRAIAEDRPIRLEEHLDTPTGRRVFLATKAPLRDAQGCVIGTFGISRDITAQKQAELAMQRAHRALLTSRACGQAVIRASDEVALLQEACHILVQVGGYQRARIALLQNATACTLQAVAEAGAASPAAGLPSLDWQDQARGWGPISEALREQRPIVAQRADTCGDQPVHGNRSAQPPGASLVVPLHTDAESSLGVLVVDAAGAERFEADTLQALQDLADDLTHGVRALRDRHERQRVQALLHEQKDRLAESQHIAQVGSWRFDPGSGRFTGSAESRRLLGLEAAEAPITLGEALQRLAPDDRPGLERWLKQLAAGSAVPDLECELPLSDGSVRVLRARGRLEPAAEGQAPGVVGTLQDVSALRHAQAERLAQEARYRELFASNPQPMWVFDRETLAFIEVNDAAIAKYGYAREEFLGMTIAQIRPEREVPRLQEHIRSREPGSSKGEIWTHRLKDGREIEVELRSHPLNFGGRPAVMVLAQDITEQRRASAALARSEHSYRMLTEQVPAIIYRAILDKLSSTSYISPAVQTLGWSAQEWLADPGIWVSSLHPEDRERVLAELARAQADGVSFDVQYRLRTRDGQWRHMHDKAELVRDGPEDPLTVQGLMLDVTQRVRDETELRKLYQAVEQSPNAIVITNLQADIEYVNQAFETSTGYRREEVIGRNPRILHPEHCEPEARAAMWAELTQGRPWRGEFVNRRKDGSTFTERAHIAPMRQADGRITHYVGVKEDVTEVKRISQELERHRQNLEALVQERTAELAEARQRAETANRAKSAFLANMSHEIRTPMNAIIGLSHLLQREPLTPQQASRLDKIHDAALHLLSLINSILDLSKIEAGKLQLQTSDFSLDELVDGVRALIADRAQAKGLALQVEIVAPVRWLHGDVTRLRQALLNYADNALKFTAEGSIRLQASLVDAGDGPLLLRLAVQDTGIGIAGEDLPRLFAAFEQADASITRRFGGTGLGLALTRRLAELMGGEAGVHSQPGSGSTFWFTARLRPAASSPSSATSATPLATDLGTPARLAEEQLRRCSAHRHVLLVEDDPANREVATELLRRAGLQVDTATDGQQAVQRVLNQRYDLVLMDLQMPLMDGLTATQHIRSQVPGGDLPILAMTANAFDQDRQRCLDAGMDDFVPKPVDPAQLYTTLLRHLAPGGLLPATLATPPAPDAPDRELPGHGSLRVHQAAPVGDGLDLPGLDAARALRSLGNDRQTYRRLLHKLHILHADDARQVQEHLAAGRWPQARQMAHQLRGAAGALGASAVQEASAALEDALRAETAADERLRLGQALQVAHQQLFDALGAWLALPGQSGIAARQATGPAAPADAAATPSVLAILDALEPMLAADDAAALELPETQRALLHLRLGALGRRLTEAIDGYAFPAALQFLQQARRDLARAAEPGT